MIISLTPGCLRIICITCFSTPVSSGTTHISRSHASCAVVIQQVNLTIIALWRQIWARRGHCSALDRLPHAFCCCPSPQPVSFDRSGISVALAATFRVDKEAPIRRRGSLRLFKKSLWTLTAGPPSHRQPTPEFFSSAALLGLPPLHIYQETSNQKILLHHPTSHQ